MLYEHCEPLTRERGDTRIFAPVSYRVVREAQLVSVVHVEALALAAWFPLCWDARQARPRLVVLRSLLETGTGHPVGSPQNARSLPLALRAYPFAVALAAEDVREGPALMEQAVPDQPTDVGAPILMGDGRPGRGAQMRLRSAFAYNAALALTEAMTADLVSLNLLDPWPLQFDVAGERIAIDYLRVVRPDAYDTLRIARFIRTFGATGARFLAAHRLSLFRAGVLLESARAALTARKPS